MKLYLLRQATIRHQWISCGLFLLLATAALGAERLSTSWKQNSEANKIIYYTAAEMPVGAELRIRVTKAGNTNVSVIVLDFHEGRSLHINRFQNVSAGQVLKYKLPRSMPVGIMVAVENHVDAKLAQDTGSGFIGCANCKSCEDKESCHALAYDFGNLGTFVLEAKVVGEDF